MLVKNIDLILNQLSNKKIKYDKLKLRFFNKIKIRVTTATKNILKIRI